MASRNYYVVLNIPEDESESGIKAAYRDLAKKHHPDRVGPQGKRYFQDISEAYETLSDPEKRRAHDSKLNLGSTVPVHARSTSNYYHEQPQAEPLIPSKQGHRRRARQEPITILDDPSSVSPSFEALAERFLRNFTGLHVPKAEKLEALNLEIFVTQEEARSGIELPIEVPAYYTCGTCRGSGRDWLFPCLHCGTRGIIEIKETVLIRTGPMLKHRSIIDIPLNGLSVNNLWLRLHINVD